MEIHSDKTDILIIEDDPEIAYLLTFILEREGFSVVVGEDGQKAFNLIDEFAPCQLVLLDIMLPYHDGFQIVDHIREKPLWNQVPILMLTAKSQEGDVVRALNAGANDFVTKPFQPAELMARIRRLLKNTES